MVTLESASTPGTLAPSVAKPGRRAGLWATRPVLLREAVAGAVMCGPTTLFPLSRYSQHQKPEGTEGPGEAPPPEMLLTYNT